MGAFFYRQFTETVGNNIAYLHQQTLQISSRNFYDPTALKIKNAVFCDMMP
jgi:hypothetical protein